MTSPRSSKRLLPLQFLLTWFLRQTPPPPPLPPLASSSSSCPPTPPPHNFTAASVTHCFFKIIIILILSLEPLPKKQFSLLHHRLLRLKGITPLLVLLLSNLQKYHPRVRRCLTACLISLFYCFFLNVVFSCRPPGDKKRERDSSAPPVDCCFVLNSELYPVQGEKRSLQLVFLNAQHLDAMSCYYYCCCAMNEVGRL